MRICGKIYWSGFLSTGECASCSRCIRCSHAEQRTSESIYLGVRIVERVFALGLAMRVSTAWWCVYIIVAPHRELVKRLAHFHQHSTPRATTNKHMHVSEVNYARVPTQNLQSFPVGKRDKVMATRERGYHLIRKHIYVLSVNNTTYFEHCDALAEVRPHVHVFSNPAGCIYTASCSVVKSVPVCLHSRFWFHPARFMFKSVW